MFVDITTMPGAPNTSNGDWLPAFYEAQLSLKNNIYGGG